eukprot:GHVH01001527.1.p1 GENE.GHVH01001527.1~~GHVH01001527.1.p1  ORF type:complete len:226 (+),score=37.15 GHVH01001527.1:457-1134(+)
MRFTVGGQVIPYVTDVAKLAHQKKKKVVIELKTDEIGEFQEDLDGKFLAEKIKFSDGLLNNLSLAIRNKEFDVEDIIFISFDFDTAKYLKQHEQFKVCTCLYLFEVAPELDWSKGVHPQELDYFTKMVDQCKEANIDGIQSDKSLWDWDATLEGGSPLRKYIKEQGLAAGVYANSWPDADGGLVIVGDDVRSHLFYKKLDLDYVTTDFTKEVVEAVRDGRLEPEI